MNRNLVVSALLALAAAGAMAQTTASTVQRDVNQQQRIENGLKNGSLTTGEAARLEREEGRVDQLQSQALKDGKLSDAERARLQKAQNKVSGDIKAAEHNGATGNPNSVSSKRMQADVQRNVNQEKRIEQGVQNGSLTNHEVAKLERGEGRIDRKEARAGADGHVGRREQRNIQHSENRESRKIYRQKHDAQERKG
jgi:hypothetical protein